METKEKDKKYSIILGIMILLFLIVVGIAIAWGLGYIHFGKQGANSNEVSSGIVDNNDDDISSESTKNPDEESQNQQPVKDNKDALKEAYKKYDFDWVSKKKNTITYVETDTIRIVTNDKGIKDVDFNYGTPKYTCPLPGHEFSGITVVTEDGEVYIGKIDDYNTYSVSAFTKVNMHEKIVDVCFSSNEIEVPYSGPYYMTESGKVLNDKGNTYEEINRDHVASVGDVLNGVYVCEDNTIDILLNDESISYNYVKAMDANKNNIKAKYIFNDSNDGVYYIVGENNKLYKINDMTTGVCSIVKDKEVTSVSYTEKLKHMVVCYSEGQKDIFDEVYTAYDSENSRYMQ